MTAQELGQRLTAQIKQYVISLGHVDSGTLVSSIGVEVQPDLGMSVVGPDYVVYLDNGNFIQNFFDLPSTINTMELYIASSIDASIEDNFDNADSTVII